MIWGGRDPNFWAEVSFFVRGQVGCTVSVSLGMYLILQFAWSEVRLQLWMLVKQLEIRHVDIQLEAKGHKIWDRQSIVGSYHWRAYGTAPKSSSSTVERRYDVHVFQMYVCSTYVV